MSASAAEERGCFENVCLLFAKSISSICRRLLGDLHSMWMLECTFVSNVQASRAREATELLNWEFCTAVVIRDFLQKVLVDRWIAYRWVNKRLCIRV